MAKSHNSTETVGPDCAGLFSDVCTTSILALFSWKKVEGSSGIEVTPGSNPRKDQFETLGTFPSLHSIPTYVSFRRRD